jgi:hypothetical protein
MDNVCDDAFLLEVESKWEIFKTIDAFTFPRLLALAKRARVLEVKIAGQYMEEEHE